MTHLSVSTRRMSTCRKYRLWSLAHTGDPLSSNSTSLSATRTPCCVSSSLHKYVSNCRTCEIRCPVNNQVGPFCPGAMSASSSRTLCAYPHASLRAQGGEVKRGQRQRLCAEEAWLGLEQHCHILVQSRHRSTIATYTCNTRQAAARGGATRRVYIVSHAKLRTPVSRVRGTHRL
jgi:hypothetical protein